MSLPTNHLPYRVLACLTALVFLTGCSSRNNASTEVPENAAPSVLTPETEPEIGLPQIYELRPDDLLSMRLPSEQTQTGWVRLFDGQSLFGWEIAGTADWAVVDGNLVVTKGEKSLLCTSVPWYEYEFSIDFKAEPETNSGIFFHTPLFPQDPATDCYELNIAPPDNPFPTGSLVQREKSVQEEFDVTEWHTYVVKSEGSAFSVTLDGKLLYTYTDENPIKGGRIGLQHNSGKVQFRNVMLRPLNLTSLLPSERPTSVDEQAPTIAGWKRYPEMAGTFTFDEMGNLHIRGGKGQLETEEQYADFVLLSRAKTAGPNQNSGIFFRCIPGEEMNGYECQINNDAKDGNLAFPADCGTGGIFRRQEARIIAAENDQWFDLLLVASGPNIATWVNGIQVTLWQDTRPADPNPRRGLRLEPGTIILQAHDETTDVSFANMSIYKHP